MLSKSASSCICLADISTMSCVKSSLFWFLFCCLHKYTGRYLKIKYYGTKNMLNWVLLWEWFKINIFLIKKPPWKIVPASSRQGSFNRKPPKLRHNRIRKLSFFFGKTLKIQNDFQQNWEFLWYMTVSLSSVIIIPTKDWNIPAFNLVCVNSSVRIDVPFVVIYRAPSVSCNQ